MFTRRSTVRCSSTQELIDGKCYATCKNGRVRNTVTRRCILQKKIPSPMVPNTPALLEDVGATVILMRTPPILWMSLSLFPEIDALFKQYSKECLVSSDRILNKANITGGIRLLEYGKNIYFPNHKQTKHFYTYGVMKYNTRIDSDNLWYEYCVGICCINNLSQYFPVFVKTYDLYASTPKLMSRLRRNVSIEGTQWTDDLLPISLDDYKSACVKYNHLCLSIQYCHDIVPLSRITYEANFKIELSIILFQIYFALSQCRHIFTHYDLHDDNVGVIPVGPNKCVEYHYTITEPSGTLRVVKFKSAYIVKIYDYGRAYFSGVVPVTGVPIDSSQVLKHVDIIPECNPSIDYGFPNFPEYHIDPTVPNTSHDLRLLYELRSALKMVPSLESIPRMLTYQTPHGTPSTSLGNVTGNIMTVMDALVYLQKCITLSNYTPSGMSLVDESNILYENHDVVSIVKVRGLLVKMEMDVNM